MNLLEKLVEVCPLKDSSSGPSELFALEFLVETLTVSYLEGILSGMAMEKTLPEVSIVWGCL